MFLDDNPICWIFTNKEGKVKRKYNSKLTTKTIYNYFEKKAIKYGDDKIVSQYIFSSDDNKIIKFENEEENKLMSDQIKLINYMNKNNIRLEKKDKINYNANLDNKSRLISSNNKTNNNNIKSTLNYEEYLNVNENNSNKINKNKPNTLIHEFFDLKMLKNFLEDFNFENKHKKRQGILQLYTNSQQDPNSTYRLIWSPSYLTAEIRHARQPKTKQGVHFYEKLITFENDDYCVNTEKVKSKIAIEKLNNICLEIIYSLHKLFDYTVCIKSAIFYVKQDLNFNINFLSCSSIGFIQYEDKSKSIYNFKGIIFRNLLSDNFPFHPYKTVYKKKDVDNYIYIECLNCQRDSLLEKFHDIDYLGIIKFHEYNRSKPAFKQFNCNVDDILKDLNIISIINPKCLDNTNTLNNSNDRIENELMRVSYSSIPSAIKKENPCIDINKYNQLKFNKLFLERKTKVCEECYFSIIDLKYYTNDDFNAIIYQGNIKKLIVRFLIKNIKLINYLL